MSWCIKELTVSNRHGPSHMFSPMIIATNIQLDIITQQCISSNVSELLKKLIWCSYYCIFLPHREVILEVITVDIKQWHF
jgi:hypothetical protein